jgi:hypothetical protein
VSKFEKHCHIIKRVVSSIMHWIQVVYEEASFKVKLGCTYGDAYCEFSTGHTTLGQVESERHTACKRKKKLKKIPNFKLHSNFKLMKMEIES